MFKNLTLYRITPGWTPNIAAMDTAMDAARFVPCSATQEKSSGWVEPRGEAHGALIESIAGHTILKLQIQTKSVPGALVAKHAQTQADRIEEETGRKPGKKETRELREDALMALLPMAFPKDAAVWVWIDPAAGLVAIDATSQAKIDEVITAMVRSFDGLSLSPVLTNVAAQSAMTAWLTTASDLWPEHFSVEREGELRSMDEEKSIVKFTRHNLATDEVRKHITEGKLPTKLAMSYAGRVGFVLTDTLQIKRIQFLEGVFNDHGADGASGFDVDVTLATGELQAVVRDLIHALGGEMTIGEAGVAS